MKERNKYVFIIGNGFDLDLGLKTRYIDFYNSSDCPTKETDFNLEGLELKLKDASKKQPNWFDIEQLLKSYASVQKGEMYVSLEKYKNSDRDFFTRLNGGLTEYLLKENKKNINKESAAAKVLKAVLTNQKYSVYNFNYTDITPYAKQLEIVSNIKFENVHGSINENSIILGVDDDAELQNGYDFLYKTFSPHYHSHNLAFDLEDAREVIFFGHSFGSIDYPYFQKFFTDATSIDRTKEESAKITIITYNEDSRVQILMQLRNMNDKRMNYLFNKNELTFIKTQDIEGNEEEMNKLMVLLKHLDETSVASDQQRFKSMASVLSR